MARSQHFSWTLNNYTAEHETSMRNLCAERPDVIYICWGRETAPQTGMRHLQGYIQLDARKRLSTVKNIIGIRTIHLEASKGSDSDNHDYSNKEGDFEEHGQRQTIGRSKKAKVGETFDLIREDLQAGASVREIAINYPMHFMKHHAGIEKLYSLLSKPTPTPYYGPFKWNIEHDWKTSLHLWGASGIGKTCFAKYLLPKALFVSHPDQLKRYNTDYDGIIFDDMDFAHWPRTAQIHLLDIDNERAIHIRYGCAYIPANTKKLFLSNTAHVFICNDPAIDRRLTTIMLE